jgi:hypothetical protein
LFRVMYFGLVLFWYSTKDWVPWIFPLWKIRGLRSGANPQSWVPEASTQTPRPPKPLGWKDCVNENFQAHNRESNPRPSNL